MGLKDRYYDYILKEKTDSEFTVQEKIVFSIMSDFTDRRGLRQEWEQIDDEIQNEIIETWINIVKEKLHEQR